MKSNLLIFVLLFCKLSFSQVTNSYCTENFILSDSEDNSNYTYNSQNFIVTNGNYEVNTANNEIKMKAGNVIVLKPDTYIKKGSLYLARIEPCTYCELNFTYSNFFTPNQDGYNDYWKINWFNTFEFSEVSIFDRYGKLIKILKNYQDKWDGKYNSNDLFSSDYWFKLIYTDCNGNKKEYKSHFSLKR
jgi:gliding motility-associated-like protein